MPCGQNCRLQLTEAPRRLCFNLQPENGFCCGWKGSRSAKNTAEPHFIGYVVLIKGWVAGFSFGVLKCSNTKMPPLTSITFSLRRQSLKLQLKPLHIAALNPKITSKNIILYYIIYKKVPHSTHLQNLIFHHRPQWSSLAGLLILQTLQKTAYFSFF